MTAALLRRMLPLALSVAAGACGGESQDLSPVRLLHSPPVERMGAPELKELSLECGRYPVNQSMRGRYEAAYCEAAIAAWSDSPLQIVILPPAAKPVP
jgi:hypothetical protein